VCGWLRLPRGVRLRPGGGPVADGGRALHQVAKWLGHSSYVLTLTTYADYTPTKRPKITARAGCACGVDTGNVVNPPLDGGLEWQCQITYEPSPWHHRHHRHRRRQLPGDGMALVAQPVRSQDKGHTVVATSVLLLTGITLRAEGDLRLQHTRPQPVKWRQEWTERRTPPQHRGEIRVPIAFKSFLGRRHSRGLLFMRKSRSILLSSFLPPTVTRWCHLIADERTNILHSARPRRAPRGAFGAAHWPVYAFGAAATAAAQPPLPPPAQFRRRARPPNWRASCQASRSTRRTTYPPTPTSTHPDVNDFFTSPKANPTSDPGSGTALSRRQLWVRTSSASGNPRSTSEPLWGSGDPDRLSARFVVQARSVVGAIVDRIVCAPTDLVGLKVCASGVGNPLPVAWPRGFLDRSARRRRGHREPGRDDRPYRRTSGRDPATREVGQPLPGPPTEPAIARAHRGRPHHLAPPRSRHRTWGRCPAKSRHRSEVSA
jgi:hypothetical protein